MLALAGLGPITAASCAISAEGGGGVESSYLHYEEILFFSLTETNVPFSLLRKKLIYKMKCMDISHSLVIIFRFKRQDKSPS